MARCPFDIEATRRLGYAVVQRLCEDYHIAYKSGNRAEKDLIEYCLTYPRNVERLTFEEQCGEQIFGWLKQTCLEMYGKFKERKRKCKR